MRREKPRLRRSQFVTCKPGAEGSRGTRILDADLRFYVVIPVATRFLVYRYLPIFREIIPAEGNGAGCVVDDNRLEEVTYIRFNREYSGRDLFKGRWKRDRDLLSTTLEDNWFCHSDSPCELRVKLLVKCFAKLLNVRSLQITVVRLRAESLLEI